MHLHKYAIVSNRYQPQKLNGLDRWIAKTTHQTVNVTIIDVNVIRSCCKPNEQVTGPDYYLICRVWFYSGYFN